MKVPHNLHVKNKSRFICDQVVKEFLNLKFYMFYIGLHVCIYNFMFAFVFANYKYVHYVHLFISVSHVIITCYSVHICMC